VAIYVDPLFRMESQNRTAFHVGERHDHHWSHLFADEPDCEELHAFARSIGLRREWFQGDHYDVTPPVRDRAIRAGARVLTLHEAVAVWQSYPRVPCGCEALRLRRATASVHVAGWVHMRYGCVLIPVDEALPHSA
jgi:hypothetical protein